MCLFLFVVCFHFLQPKTCIHPVTGKPAAYTPHGLYPHLTPAEKYDIPEAHHANPWWKDEQYVIGIVSPLKFRLLLFDTNVFCV
jgi:hypothetical protein